MIWSSWKSTKAEGGSTWQEADHHCDGVLIHLGGKELPPLTVGLKAGEVEENAGSLGGYWVDECSVSTTCIEHVPCVKQRGHSGGHIRYGCCSQGKYSLVGKGNNKTNKRTTNLSWSQCHFNVVETEPESDHVAAFQISWLHSLCQVIFFPCIYSFIQSSICYLTSVCPELLFCFLFCATGGSPRD